MRWLDGWSDGWSRRWLATVAVLVALLALLATLQYRWVARLSEAEQTRLAASLEHSARAVASELDLELTRAYQRFELARPHDEAELAPLLAARWAAWRQQARWPELVRDLHVIRREASGEVVLLAVDEVAGSLTPRAWDGGLDRVRRSLRAPGAALDGDLPGLVVAIREHSGDDGPGEWRSPRDHLVVRLDRAVLVGTVLPQLVASHFGTGDGLVWSLTVAPLERPHELLFASGPAAAAAPVVASARLLALRPDPELSAAARSDQPTRWPPPGREPPRAAPAPPELRARSEAGRWLLAVRHPTGSLAEVVAGTRRRNLAFSLAVLALLGATVVMTVVSGRRAERLARQQLAFVAAVSHELRTPLTAIRSAGQNLADGIVDDPERVRSYGALVEREGRRLSEMIGRVLTYAGISSGRQIFRMAPVDLGQVVAAALADCRWLLDEKGFTVDCAVDPELPAVHGDAAALRQVVANLVDNSVKYAAAGRWLGVRVSADSAAGELSVAVADRGPGVAKRDLPQLFEPFYRGDDTATRALPGSGLGLALVRGVVAAHGGRVTVSSAPGSGAVFTIQLPTAGVAAGGRGGSR